MTIDRHVSGYQNRGHTMRNRIAAGVLATILSFTAGCGMMNRQYMQAERDAASDQVTMVDSGSEDARLPAIGVDADLDARIPVQDAGDELDSDADATPLPAGVEQPAPEVNEDPVTPAETDPACMETRFQMHYNSTSFIDDNSPLDIATFVRDSVERGHDQLYIAGFASIENRDDMTNNDAPYNDWLANQRAERVLEIVRQVAEDDGLDLDVAVRSYAETDEIGPELSDNRAVILTTRPLPDIDESANAAVAAEIRSHAPNALYDVACDVQSVDDTVAEDDGHVRLPIIDVIGRVFSYLTTSGPESVPEAPEPATRAPANATPAPGPAPAPAVQEATPDYSPAPTTAPAVEAQPAPAPVTPAPAEQPAPAGPSAPVITAPSGAQIHFGSSPLPPIDAAPAQPADDGFIESGPVALPPDYQAVPDVDDNGEGAPTPEPAQPPAEPAPALPPAPEEVEDITAAEYEHPDYVPFTEAEVASIQAKADKLAGDMLGYTSLATKIESQCGADGYGNSLCEDGFDAQCGEDNDPRTPSELGETTVCREAYITLDQRLEIAEADLHFIENKVDQMLDSYASLPSTLEEAIADLNRSVQGLDQAMQMYDVPVVPANYQHP